MCENIFLCCGLIQGAFYGRNTDTGIKAHSKQSDNQKDSEDNKQDAQIPFKIYLGEKRMDFFLRFLAFFLNWNWKVFIGQKPRQSCDCPEFIGKNAYRREPLLRRFGKGGLQDLVDLFRYSRYCFRGGGHRTAGMLHHNGKRGMSPEKLSPGDHFVKYHSEGILIRPPINRAAKRDFRCGIIRIAVQIVIPG